MKYSDFIIDTTSHKNSINWNYYENYMEISEIFNENFSNGFIKKYFENGEKTLPFLLDPEEADEFISKYFIAGRKEFALSYSFKEQNQLPPERAIHTVSGFFLGLLIENCINSTVTLSLNSINNFPFSYLWFLTFLYHDYGYCVTEREGSIIKCPQHANIPCHNNPYNKRCSLQEHQSLSAIKRKLGIDLSPFSQVGTFAYNSRQEPKLRHALLSELTQRNNTISGHPKLHFSNGSIIKEHQYPSHIITRYMNYCINERHRVDHGIVGGLLFYDRMIKNYMLAYISSINNGNANLDLCDFYYRNRHFCKEQLTIFSYISDCILSHNIYKQSQGNRAVYEKYLLDDLLEENFKTITYESNPLLYILAISDTMEPIKTYQQNNKKLSAQEIAEAIKIEYIPGKRSLKFSSASPTIDINTLYQKAKGLTDWTSVKCSRLLNGVFTLKI